jgi:hypothetical protein
MATGNANYDTFASSTIRSYRPTLIENVVDQQALFFQIKQRGMYSEESGSRAIVQPLMYGTNSTVGSYSGFDPLDLTPQEGMTSSEYSWKFYHGSVSISGEDEWKNSGSSTRVFDLLKAKIRQLEISFKLQLNEDLFGLGTANDSKVLTGLGAAVEDGAAWSTYGGIDSSVAANAWWRNQYLDFDGTYTTIDTADGPSYEGLTAMRVMFNNCLRGEVRSAPTLIVTTQALFEWYEKHIEGDKQRVVANDASKVMADAGFLNLGFKGTPIIWDEDMDANEMLFLNAQYLGLVVGKGRNFKSLPFERPENQDAKFSHLLFAGNLVATRRDVHGRIVDMD